MGLSEKMMESQLDHVFSKFLLRSLTNFVLRAPKTVVHRSNCAE